MQSFNHRRYGRENDLDLFLKEDGGGPPMYVSSRKTKLLWQWWSFRDSVCDGGAKDFGGICAYAGVLFDVEMCLAGKKRDPAWTAAGMYELWCVRILFVRASRSSWLFAACSMGNLGISMSRSKLVVLEGLRGGWLECSEQDPLTREERSYKEEVQKFKICAGKGLRESYTMVDCMSRGSSLSFSLGLSTIYRDARCLVPATGLGEHGSRKTIRNEHKARASGIWGAWQRECN